MRSVRLWMVGIAMLLVTCPVGWSQPSAGKRKIIIDQDAAGPGGTDQQSILLLIQSPQAEVLGVTVVTGDAWLKEEVAHTLRLLEIIGRTDIPVVPGAEYPLVRRKEDTELWEQQYGSVPWVGAWTPQRYHPADQLGRNAGGPAHDKTDGRRRGAFSAAHGPQIPARNYHLRRWADDQPCAGAFDRS